MGAAGNEIQRQWNKVGEGWSVPARRGRMRLLLSFLRGDGNLSHLDFCASLEGRVAPRI